MSVKDEVEIKSITTEEKEELLKESKKTLPRKTLGKSSDLSSFLSKKEFESFKKELKVATDGHIELLEKMNDNFKAVIASLNVFSKRLDALEKEVVKLPNNDQKNLDLQLRFEALEAKDKELEDEVGDIIDKLDVIFVGEDNNNLRSKIERLEQNVFSRLHKKNA